MKTTKVRIKKCQTGGTTGLVFDDTNPGKRKKFKNVLNHNYGFDGIIDENGAGVDNPTQEAAMKTMIQFMKNNWDTNAPNPSNNYNPQWQHTSVEVPRGYVPTVAEFGGKFQQGGLADFLSKSKDYKDAAAYGDNRKALAAKMGIQDYNGTVEQNNELYKRLNTGKTTNVPVKRSSPSPASTAQAPMITQPGSQYNWRNDIPFSKDTIPSTKNARADNSGLPQDLLPYFKRQADANNGRVMFTDKGSKKTYYGTRDKTGKYNLTSFDVLTGKNDNPNDATGKYYDAPLDQMQRDEKKGNIKSFITPMGSYALSINPDIYGSPGLNMGTMSPAIHKVYPAEYAARTKVLNDGNPNNNNMSWGCINGNCEDVQKLIKFTQPKDSMFIGDSRLPQNVNMNSINNYHKFGGSAGMNQTNYALDRGYTTAIPGKKADTQALNSFIKQVPRDQANIEAEQGETVLGDFDQDGQLEHMKIGGDRHFNGGTPLSVPKGAFIFSDTPKMKIGGQILNEFGKGEKSKKKFTPAQLAKQYDLNFFKDKGKEPGNDKFARDTAELMLANNEEKLGKLAFVQEAMKGFPTGIPGVTQQIQQDQQGEPQMRFGGIPMMQNGGGFKPWPGDKMENKKNASKYTADQIAQKAKALGYDGPADNLSLQTWIQNEQGLSNDRVDRLHATLPPTPHGGKLDGKWGYRWDTALDNFSRKNQPATPVPFGRQPLQQTINPNRFTGNTNVPPVAGAPVAPGIPGLNPNDPRFNNGKPTSISPNAWDVMGTLHAATRPIDHIRPQGFRVDAQVSDPTFMDNRAEIQQVQSMAKSANDVVTNTASGQVARANSMGNFGRTFDAINNSDMQTQNANVGIENQFKSNRDQVMNQNALTNLNLLSKFVGENDMYRANLSKEKQLKFTDTIDQGENMTNNMITMGSILERTPNFTVKGPFWNPSFKPGAPGTNLLGANNTQGEADQGKAQLAMYQSLIKDHGMSSSDAVAYMKMLDTKTSRTYKGTNTTPSTTTVTD